MDSLNGCGISQSEAKLKDLVLSCVSIEDMLYMSNDKFLSLTKSLISESRPWFVAALAINARSEHNLVYVPLMLLRELARNGSLNCNTLTYVIQTPYEMCKFLDYYWSEGKQPLSNQVKKGIAECFNKFSVAQLTGWVDCGHIIKLRDILFLAHPKPSNQERAKLFQVIANSGTTKERDYGSSNSI